MGTAPFTTELKVPPELAFGTLVASFVGDAVRRAELEPDRERALVAAVERGFATIVEQALAQEREPIRVVAANAPLDLTVSLFERGLPMDDALARRDSHWDEIAAGADAVHWRCHGTAGSELRFVVDRTSAPPNAAEAQPAAAEEAIPLAPEQAYAVRRFEPDDADGVARAFYLTYGYAYDMSDVYTPKRLVELNESGRYVSIVALTESGDVVGHCALARDNGDAAIADLAGAVVLPAHRGRDLLNRLIHQAESEAAELDLAAYFSEPVTDHPLTQRSSESFGMTACGVTLGEAPRRFLARHMVLAATAQRQSCMLYVKPLRPREERTIYAPPHHRAIVAAIYERLNLSVAFGEGVPPSGRGLFHTTMLRGDAIATIEIEAVGAETPQLVRQAAEDLCATRRLGAIYAELPLEDPGTPALCDALERHGFFFSGVGPLMLNGKDALRLQMPLTPIDPSQLVVVGEFGKELLHYVASQHERRAG